MKCVNTITGELNYNMDINISRVDQIRAYALLIRLFIAYIHVFDAMMRGIPLITNVSA
jgi:hypothetical protein